MFVYFHLEAFLWLYIGVLVSDTHDSHTHTVCLLPAVQMYKQILSDGSAKQQSESFCIAGMD